MAIENQTTAPEGMPSSEEIFRSAMTPEPAPEQKQEQPAPQPDPGERQRDERGRFAPAAATPQPPEPGQQPTADDGGPVPSWRHRELREQRDAVEMRARQFEQAYYEETRRRRAYEDMIQQARQAQQPQPQPPDPITDPQGYHAFINNQLDQRTKDFEERLRNQEANFSFRIAHDRNREMFESAYTEMIARAEHGDPAVVRAVMASPDPGAAMLNWYQRETTLTRVGNDPDRYFEMEFERRLKDPNAVGALYEKFRSLAQQTTQPGGGPVQLPPSLNRMAASAPAGANGDLSHNSLFDYAMRQGRPQR
jgi:hypothetical protein